MGKSVSKKGDKASRSTKWGDTSSEEPSATPASVYHPGLGANTRAGMLGLGGERVRVQESAVHLTLAEPQYFLIQAEKNSTSIYANSRAPARHGLPPHHSSFYHLLFLFFTFCQPSNVV